MCGLLRFKHRGRGESSGSLCVWVLFLTHIQGNSAPQQVLGAQSSVGTSSLPGAFPQEDKKQPYQCLKYHLDQLLHYIDLETEAQNGPQACLWPHSELFKPWPRSRHGFTTLLGICPPPSPQSSGSYTGIGGSISDSFPGLWGFWGMTCGHLQEAWAWELLGRH